MNTILTCSVEFDTHEHKTSGEWYRELRFTPDSSQFNNIMDAIESSEMTVNLFKTFLSKIPTYVDDIDGRSDVKVLVIKMYQEKPYYSLDDDRKERPIRINKTPIPLEWIKGEDEQLEDKHIEIARTLAIKMSGRKLHIKEIDAITAFEEKSARKAAAAAVALGNADDLDV